MNDGLWKCLCPLSQPRDVWDVWVVVMAICHYNRIKLCGKRVAGLQITPRHGPFGIRVLPVQPDIQNQRLEAYQRPQLLRVLVKVLFHNLV